MTEDEIVEKFSFLCDAIERIFYADKDGIVSYEEMMEAEWMLHTSDEARKGANAVFEALGL